MLFRTRYNVLFRQFRLLTAQAGSIPAAIRLIFENCYKRIFCASPIYGSADDFTSPLNFTPCNGVTPAAKQQVGETRKKRLAQRLAFFRFDISSGIIKGEQPLIRASRASKVAGAFLVLFWHAKENLAFPQQRFNQRNQRVKPFIKKSTPHSKKAPQRGAFCSIIFCGSDSSAAGSASRRRPPS